MQATRHASGNGRSRCFAAIGAPVSVAGFTLVELLVVIAIISILAGFLVPTIQEAREKANTVACSHKLREFTRLSLTYANDQRFFPHAKVEGARAHDHLNVLIAASPEMFKPDLFICPNWRGEAAVADAQGEFILDEDSCAYAYSRIKLAPTDANRIVASDKRVRSSSDLSGHKRGMNVAYTDTSVVFVSSAELDLEGGVLKDLVD